MFARLPPYSGISESTSATSAPSSTRRRARFEPMKPSPPVISTRLPGVAHRRHRPLPVSRDEAPGSRASRRGRVEQRAAVPSDSPPGRRSTIRPGRTRAASSGRALETTTGSSSGSSVSSTATSPSSVPGSTTATRRAGQHLDLDADAVAEPADVLVDEVDLSVHAPAPAAPSSGSGTIVRAPAARSAGSGARRRRRRSRRRAASASRAGSAPSHAPRRRRSGSRRARRCLGSARPERRHVLEQRHRGAS